MPPRFSIIIPTFNRRFYLEKALRSIQNQNFQNFEVIVVDDGSVDDTATMISSLSGKDERIHYIYQGNSGRSAARNRGIENSRGEYLLFLDSDDMMAEGALSFLAGKIQDYPQAQIIGGTVELIDETDNLTEEQSPRRQTHEGIIKAPYLDLIRNYYLPMGSYIVRRDVVTSDNEGFVSDLEPCEDFDFGLRMAKRSQLAYFERPIAKIRKHGGNTPLDIFCRTGIRVAYKNLADLNSSVIENKRLVKAEWKNNLADDFFHQGKSKDAFYNYVLAAYYNPRKVFNRIFCQQVLLCFAPPSIKKRLKKSLRNSGVVKTNS